MALNEHHGMDIKQFAIHQTFFINNLTILKKKILSKKNFPSYNCSEKNTLNMNLINIWKIAYTVM